ncbi:hypothetical protein Tco_0573137 [Tanacetum coccineum]
MTRWLTDGGQWWSAAVDRWYVESGLTCEQFMSVRGSIGGTDTVSRIRYEDQTDMSADMSVRGTRWQDTSVRGTVQVAAGPIRA